MVDIRDQVRRIFDRVEPIALEEVEAASRRRRRRRRHRRILAVSGGASALGAIIVAVLVIGGTTVTRVTVGPMSNHPLRSQVSPQGPPAAVSLSAALRLSAHSVLAGGTLGGQVIIENDTGSPMHVATCGVYQAALANGSYRPNVVWPACATRTTVPLGRSTYPVTILARYHNCVPSNSPPCVDQQPLPPGDYQIKVFASSPLLPLPAPVDISVLPSASSAQQDVTVPLVVGQAAGTAARELKQVGLVTRARAQPGTTAPPGTVVSESPPAGSNVAVGSIVSLTVSTGPPVSHGSTTTGPAS